MRRPVITYRNPVNPAVPIEVLHDDMLCMPWGLYVIRVGTDIVGRQLSYPEESSCVWMAGGVARESKAQRGANWSTSRAHAARAKTVPATPIREPGRPANPPTTASRLYKLTGGEVA